MPEKLTTPSFEYPESELVFGVVSPVGTDLNQLDTTVSNHLRKFRYRLNSIRLSEFLTQPKVAQVHRIRLRSDTEFNRINSYIDAGNRTREITRKADVLALYAASAISKKRLNAEPLPSTLHLLISLKRPEEVATLRRIYGPGFFLIGVYSPEADRLAYLREEKNISSPQAAKLIDRDRDEVPEFGQRTRNTFQMADVFVRLSGGDLNAFQREVRRFVDLVFGDPFSTPTRHEHAMFLAYAASLRSADLSRQVGAVVVSEAGEVVATGANDVPRFGGGLYWPDREDQRDYVKGSDSNKVEIEKIVRDIIERVRPGDDLIAGAELERRLSGSRLHDLTEFGRPVHAEMEALLSCARVGVSARNGTVYATTFPCHNCAKHMVAAGIREVQYVEPYPKSRALELHGDSISVDTAERDKVSFLPFVGVTARRYFDLFSMQLSDGSPLKRKGPDGMNKAEFRRMAAKPRVPLSFVSYIEREKVATRDILATMGKDQENGQKSHGKNRSKAK